MYHPCVFQTDHFLLTSVYRCMGAAAFLLLFGASLAPAAETADLIVTGGKVVTMDEDLPVAEAIAVRGDRILAVGSVAQIAKHSGPKTARFSSKDNSSRPDSSKVMGISSAWVNPKWCWI